MPTTVSYHNDVNQALKPKKKWTPPPEKTVKPSKASLGITEVYLGDSDSEEDEPKPPPVLENESEEQTTGDAEDGAAGGDEEAGCTASPCFIVVPTLLHCHASVPQAFLVDFLPLSSCTTKQFLSDLRLSCLTP
jgi:hypothetical protein